ncbi:hypothetical protein B566_EDAN001463 [Ephemera danica]|nr:hypothetical protein B566_EDAN001463 [Ephemera danica]
MRLNSVQCTLLLLASSLALLASPTSGARLSPEAVAAWLEESGLEPQQVGRRSSSSESGSLWFGPRLGRRRRSPPEDEEALLSYPSGKRQTLTFTPRLGREMDESELTVGLRTPPFSPRLGRGNGLPFSPRLGRQQQQAPTRVEQHS